MEFMPFFDWVVRATLLLGFVLLVIRLVERRSATAAHRILTTALLCILCVLPIAMIVSPIWHWQVPLWNAPGSASLPDSSPSTAELNTTDVSCVHERNAAERSEIEMTFSESSLPAPAVGDGNLIVQQLEDPRNAQSSAEVPAETMAAVSEAAGALSETSATQAPQAVERFTLTWRSLVMGIWTAVCVVLCMRLGRSVLWLRCVVGRGGPATPEVLEQVRGLARQCGVNRPLKVVLSERGSMPMACWVGRWIIVVPADINSWPDDLREVTLLHELGHVARRDAWVDYFSQCAACLLWPIPLVWLAAADIRRLRERACDEWSLARYRKDAKHYAVSLVEVVRRCQQQKSQLACAMADQRGFEARLKWVFSNHASRKRWRLVSLPVGLVVVVLSIAAATAVPIATPVHAEQQDSAAEQSEPSTAPRVIVSEEPAPATPTISVKGIVQDRNGNPLKGAQVVLRANFKGEFSMTGLNHSRDVLARTTTDAQGRYDFSEIRVPPRLQDQLDHLRQGQPGAQLIAWAEGAALQWQPVNAFEQPDINFQLQNQIEVVGMAVDEMGAPLQNAEITITGLTKATERFDVFLRTPEDLNLARSEVEFSGSIQDGEFSLSNMPADYRISASLESRTGHRTFFVIDTGDGTYTELTSRNGSQQPTSVYRSPIQVSVPQKPYVVVQVVDSEGQPVTEGGLQAITAQGQYGGSAAINEGGSAVLIVLEPGVHRITYTGDPIRPRVRVSQSVEIPAAGQKTFEMRLPASRPLSGKVIDDATGKPVPGAYVVAGPASGDESQASVLGSMAISGTDGTFKLPLPEGEWKLVIQGHVDGYLIPGYFDYQEAGSQPEGLTVTVNDDEPIDNVVLRLYRGLVIQGTVLDEQGAPASNLPVVARNDGRQDRQSVTRTDANGHYRCVGLSPRDPVRIFVTSDTGNAETVIPPSSDQPFNQTLMKEENLSLRSTTSVAGKVIQGDRPAPGVAVKLHRSPPLENGDDRRVFRLVSQTKTDEEGRYRLTGLHQGDQYWLVVEAPVGAEVRNWSFSVPRFHTVDVEDGSTINIPVAELATNGQTLSGIVVDPAGNPVSGVTVSASLRSGRNLSHPQNGPPPWTETGEDGRFHLTYLPDEPLSLMVYIRPEGGGGGRILHPGHARPEMNADDIRIIYDPSLSEAPEDLD